MPTRLCARADAPEAVRPRPSVLLAGRATDARRNARCSWPLTNLAMHPRRGCARGFFRRALASLHKAHVQGARRMHCAMAQRGILTSHGDAAPKSAQPPAMALRLGEYVVPARPRHRVTRIFLQHHFSRARTRRRWWWRCRLASRGEGEARAQRRGGVASCKARAASSSGCGRRRSPQAISGVPGFVGRRTIAFSVAATAAGFLAAAFLAAASLAAAARAGATNSAAASAAFVPALPAPPPTRGLRRLRPRRRSCARAPLSSPRRLLCRRGSRHRRRCARALCLSVAVSVARLRRPRHRRRRRLAARATLRRARSSLAAALPRLPSDCRACCARPLGGALCDQHSCSCAPRAPSLLRPRRAARARPAAACPGEG